MRIKQARYELARDGEQLLHLVLIGPCEDECRKLEERLDKGENVEMAFSSSRRSLDQNSFYWVLVGRIAKYIEASTIEVHNTMLRRYGVPKLMDGQMMYVMLPDTEEVERKTLGDMTTHLRPTSQTKEGKQNVTFRVYVIMKGSSEMDTNEMASLINGAQSECREMGLPWQVPWEVL